MANPNARKATVGVVLTPAQRGELDTAALAEGVTRSTYAARLVVRHLAGIKAAKTRRGRKEPQGAAA